MNTFPRPPQNDGARANIEAMRRTTATLHDQMTTLERHNPDPPRPVGFLGVLVRIVVVLIFLAVAFVLATSQWVAMPSVGP